MPCGIIFIFIYSVCLHFVLHQKRVDPSIIHLKLKSIKPYMNVLKWTIRKADLRYAANTHVHIGDHRQRVTHSLSAEHCYVCADRWNIEYYSRSCQLRFTDFKWNNLVTTLLTDLWVVCHTNRALFAIRLFWPNK